MTSPTVTTRNQLMEHYRTSVMPAPLLMWRTVDNSVSSMELTTVQFAAVKKLLGIL